jgi:hypothetical protein
MSLRDHELLTLGSQSRIQLDQLARDLALGPHDLLLVGDGTGETYQSPAGWACIAYDRLLERAVVHVGALTAGSIKFAELLPFLHGLWFFDQEHRDDRLRSYQVAVVSDSEVTVRCGNGDYARRANGCLWAGIEWFERRAYAFQWHHVRRLSNGWNALVDSVAGKARQLALGVLEIVQSGAGD